MVDLSADLRAQLVLSSGKITDRAQEIHDEIDALVKELAQLEMRQAEKKGKGPKVDTRREAEVPQPVFEVSDFQKREGREWSSWWWRQSSPATPSWRW